MDMDRSTRSGWGQELSFLGFFFKPIDLIAPDKVFFYLLFFFLFFSAEKVLIVFLFIDKNMAR